MIFQLFKPKWQHSNPKIRRQAYEQMDIANAEHQAILLEGLRLETDPVLRQWLVRHINDLTVLRATIKNDADAMVRDTAQQRWRRILAGQEPGLELEQCRSEIDACSDDAMLMFIARQGTATALRQHAMLRIGREPVYAEMAMGDTDAELRLLAAQLLHTPSVMERVLKAAKNKDKRVRALLQQRLDELAAAAEKPAQCYREMKQLCIKLEAESEWLENHNDDERVAERAKRLCQAWNEVLLPWQASAQPDKEGLLARFHAADHAVTTALVTRAQASAQQRMQAEAQHAALAQRVALCARLETVVADARAWVEPDLAQAAALTEAENAIVDAWDALGEAPNNDASVKDYARLREELDRLRTAVPHSVRARQQLLDVLSQVRSALSQPHKVSQAQAKRWMQQRQQAQTRLAFPLPVELAEDLTSTFDQLTQQLSQQRAQQRTAVERFVQAVPELRQLIEAGQIKAAQALTHELQDSLRAWPNAEREKLQHQQVYRDYQAALKQLSELHDWKTWAATPIRERLRDEMKLLADDIAAHPADTSFDFAQAAQQVKAARKQWADLGVGEGHQSGAVWQEFNEACNRAYAPCQQFFELQAQTRANHAQQKARLCAELEQFHAEHIAGKEPSSVDWRLVNTKVRDGYRLWEACGPVDRKEQGVLSTRFRAVMDQLKRAVNEDRERNSATKEALLSRAEQWAAKLAAQPDAALLDEAITEIKIIQREWQAIGSAFKDKALWEKLRAAADQIYASRQAQFEFQAEVQRVAVAERERLCHLLEQLARLEGAELRQARTQRKHIQDEWASLTPVSRELSKFWDKRFRDAHALFDRALATLDQIEAEAARSIVVEQGLLCNRVEAALEAAVLGKLDDGALKTAVTEQSRAWAFLMEAAEQANAVLGQRWSDVHAGVARWLAADINSRVDLAQDFLSNQTQHARAKEDLVLRSELLTEAPSPPAWREQRLQLQMSMLADKMRGNTAAANPNARELLIAWHALGYAGAELEPALQERFAAVVAALKSRVQNR